MNDGIILPSGYTRLEYIEQPLGNSGSISTYLASSNTIGFSITAMTYDNFGTSNYGALFGSRYASQNSELQLTTYNGSGETGGKLGTGTNRYSANLVKNQKFTVSLIGTTYNNGNSTITVERDIANSYIINIFGLNNNGTITQHGHGRIYSLIFYDGNTIVRNYIPCISPWNHVGLYDLVSESFFGTTAGNDIVAGPLYEEIPNIPSEYTELEYIEQPLGNEGYIKSGLIPSNTLNFEIDAVTYDTITNTSPNYRCLFGSRTGATNEYQLTTYIDAGATNKGTLRCGTTVYDAKLVKNERFEASLIGNTYTHNGSSTTVVRDFTNTDAHEMYIWAFNVADGGTDRVRQIGHGKIYHLKFIDNGVVVRNYYPCKSKSGTVGLYDVENGVFYSSEATAFVAGPVKFRNPLTVGVAQKIIDLQMIKEDLRSAINEHYSSEQLAYSDGLVDYADAIDGITVGALPAETRVVNFFDYDGTLLYAFTAAEFTALNEMPHNPYHPGLIAQGWNWSRAQVLDYLQRADRIDISQHYITDDDSTRLYINKRSLAEQKLIIYQEVANGVKIDWGDGSTYESQSGTGAKTFTHTYSNTGEYVIRIIPVSGTFDFGSNPTSTSTSMSSVFGGSTTNRNLIQELYKVEIGSHMSRIGACAFYYYFNLRTITIPMAIKEYRYYSFYMCISLKHITLSQHCQILYSCFYYCTDLRCPCAPATMRSIANSSFRSTYEINYIVLGDNITSVPSNAFYQAYDLTNIYLSKNLTSFGTNAFRENSSLEKFKIPNKVTSLGGTNVGSYVYICSTTFKLQKIVVPEGVSVIPAYCFPESYGTMEVWLPSTITDIGTNSIRCFSLKTFVIKAEEPPNLTNADLANFTTGVKLYVPYSADHSILTAYQNATNWSTYASYMVELDENGEIPSE